MKTLTREQDRAVWVMARLDPHPSNQRITYARFCKLGVDYERLHPFEHHAPTNVRRYGQRLSERALALSSR